MDIDPEGEEIREVFAYFGHAAYMAGFVETGMANALTQIDFLG